MLKKFLKKFFSKEVIYYLFFGVLTTLIDAIVFYIFNNIFKINYIISTIIAWSFAILFAYITNKTWVFKSKENSNILKEFISFVSFRIASLIMSIIFMIIFIEILSINEFISKLMVNVFVVIANYFFSKILIFK